MRTRILPVLGTIPAIFGQTMATHVINQLSKLKYMPSASPHIGKDIRINNNNIN